jgi:hypothetical protein
MQARLQEFAGSVLPNILQYPFKRLKKSYDNFSESRKLTTTSIRLASEVSGAVLSATSVLMSSDMNTVLKPSEALHLD